MTRNALRRYLYSLVVASLPGCCRETAAQYRSVYVDAAIFDSDGGAVPPDVCGNVCKNDAGCTAAENNQGQPYVSCLRYPAGQYCGPPLPGGRPPAGLRPVAIFCGDPVGAWFAYMAHVEGAAVHGFLQLAGELQALGAPAALIDAAHEAAADERRHARIARRLAKTAVPPVVIDPTPPRSVFAIALDNAVEGGVFETFGAAITLWQSRAAGDPRIRAAFCRISEDELRHAELARAVARWLEPRLTASQRAEIARARRDAATRLAEMVAQPADETLVRVAGLPPAAVALSWVTQMTSDLWEPMVAA